MLQHPHNPARVFSVEFKAGVAPIHGASVDHWEIIYVSAHGGGRPETVSAPWLTKEISWKGKERKEGVYGLVVGG